MKNLIFGTRDELYQAGFDVECGEPQIDTRYFVVAMSPDGRQWASTKCWSDDQECQDVCETYKLKGVSQSDFEANFYEIDPAYGSQAYEQLDDAGYWREREMAEDRY
tara:strand:+ start:165 stop:485 length:321 start_codon:yes stop_codon:yes gene_type:complete